MSIGSRADLDAIEKDMCCICWELNADPSVVEPSPYTSWHSARCILVPFNFILLIGLVSSQWSIAHVFYTVKWPTSGNLGHHFSGVATGGRDRCNSLASQNGAGLCVISSTLQVSVILKRGSRRLMSTNLAPQPFVYRRMERAANVRQHQPQPSGFSSHIS
jgi:hypothetical protein